MSDPKKDNKSLLSIPKEIKNNTGQINLKNKDPNSIACGYHHSATAKSPIMKVSF